MILPLLAVLLAALLLLGLMLAERHPVSTWRDGLRGLREAARDTDSRAEVIPQEAKLEDLMTRDDSAVYTGTESFSGLVDVVEKAMDKASDTAESTSAVIRRSRSDKAHRPAAKQAPAPGTAGPN